MSDQLVAAQAAVCYPRRIALLATLAMVGLVSATPATAGYTVTLFNNFEPRVINASGEMAGYDLMTDEAAVEQNGQMHDLGSLGGGLSQANGINDSGAVVGDSNNVAILYQNGQMINLNNWLPSGSHYESATAINNSGQIVGYAYNSKGSEYGFLLSPHASAVPLPGTLPLVRTPAR